MVEIHLCALDSAMARAWATHFGSQSGVLIHEGDILAKQADAILSPANSFGFMDGGMILRTPISLAGSFRIACVRC